MNQAPWIENAARRMISGLGQNTSPLLAYGHSVVELEQSAVSLLSLMLCEQPESNTPCNLCRGCQMRLSGNHPDLHWIMPQEMAIERGYPVEVKKGNKPSKEIRIDEVRQMQAFFNTSSSRGKQRWAVVMPFEAINLNAANALLKVLEEPPNGLRFILLGQRPEYLLPTILSRVQRVKMPVITPREKLDWLKSQGVEQAETLLGLALGDPFGALSMSQETDGAVELRKNWLNWLATPDRPSTPPNGLEKLDRATLLDVAMALSSDLLAVKYQKPLSHFDWIRSKLVWARNVELERLSDMFNYFVREKRLANKPLNPRLALENIAQTWQANTTSS